MGSSLNREAQISLSLAILIISSGDPVVVPGQLTDMVCPDSQPSGFIHGCKALQGHLKIAN